MSIYISIVTLRTEPADLNSYRPVVYAVRSRRPEVEQDPEPSRGVSWPSGACEALCCFPQPVTGSWDPPKGSVWPRFSCVQRGHLNASCRRVGGAPLLPVREIGENLISTCFSTSVRLFFRIATLFNLTKTLKNLKIPCALISSSAKWVKPRGAGTPGW